MSVDTVDELVAAWRAGMEDASKDETAREKWLREQLGATVTRAEQAERERDEARAELARVQGLPELEWARVAAVIMQGLALHARTDQPAAKRMVEALNKGKTYVGRLKERAERAEADNAALLGALRRLYHGYGDCIATAEDRAHARDVLALPHPGTAPLERVLALENFARDGLAAYHGHKCTMARGPYPSNPTECSDLHCRDWARALEKTS